MIVTVVKTLVICVIFSSCSAGDDSPFPTVMNRSPKVPNLIFSTNSLICISVDLEFGWRVSIDPDQDGVIYKTQITEEESFQDIAFSEGNAAIE